ncbi:uncharacterized protein LOC127719907 isoform X2 [Mytilus californianus]|uniref:uncharacterized protein LOC127719907 isoform X2 n=1 Tax=Mytilus californianus TaxID=6549 RepID=UPI002247AA89|nr:uncharacterized protein LOC127719907 isoform X2 [Mytilus californianus]
MSDEEEIVGSDFIGSDDEEKSVEALELKLQKILQEKEKLEKQKKKDELLSKIKQAEAALSNLQTLAEPSKSEVDSWTTDEIRQFFRRKGIIVKNKPLEHLRKLAKSVIDSKIPDHKTTAPSEISKRTINYNGKDLTFPGIKDKSLSNWSDDISSLPSVDHVQAHAYIISSAEFDLERFRNIQKEDSYLLYKGNAIKKCKVHKLDEGFCYVTCNCMSSKNSQTNLEVVWTLIQNDGCIQTAGCSCDEGSDCCMHTIALMLTLASLNKSNNYAADKVQRVDIGTKLYANRSLTNLQHGKDGFSKTNYLGEEMKESRRNKVYTYQSEGSEEEEEAAPEVWVPPTMLENKSAIADRINESLSKQNDRSNPLRKSHNNYTFQRFEPNTSEKGNLDPNSPKLHMLNEKSTGDATSINQLQSKFEARLTKSPIEVKIEGAGKSSEISAHNRETQLNSRILHNIKEIEKPRKESTEPKPLIPSRENVLSNLKEQSMKRDRQQTVGKIPTLQENALHSNTIKTTGNGGMIFKNVPLKSGEINISHKPMTNSENLPVNTCITMPTSSKSYPHATSIEQTTVHIPVTPSVRSQLGFANKYPLHVTDPQQKPISGLGYPMQVNSTAVPTDVSTYTTGQLPKPSSSYLYPQQTIASTVTRGYNPVYQPTVPVPLVYPAAPVLFPAEQPHVNFMSNVAPVSNHNKPQVIMDPQPGLFGPRYPTAYPYSSSNASFPTPLVYPSDETRSVKNKQSVHTFDIVETNSDVQKPKVCRKDRFMTPAPTLDENKESSKPSLSDRCSSNTSVAATKVQRITYDRKYLLRLRRSVFSQRRPDNIDHIPEIQVVSYDGTPVTYRPFTFTPGYVKRATDMQSIPATDKPAVRSKPKRNPLPDADAHPGAVSIQPQMSTEEIMRKAIGAINMVKHGCDSAMVVKVISDLPINTEDALSRIVNLVVDTAVDEPSCLSVCTSLCRTLSRAKVQSRNDPGESVTFSTTYRQKCTKEIEQGILSRSTESYNRRIEEIARFTGIIARLILLKTCDIHSILMKFAQTKSEHCLECFCTLLTDVWERMVKCTSANYLDQYYEVIDEVLLYSETHAALKYKLGQLKSKQR